MGIPITTLQILRELFSSFGSVLIQRTEPTLWKSQYPTKPCLRKIVLVESNNEMRKMRCLKFLFGRNRKVENWIQIRDKIFTKGAIDEYARQNFDTSKIDDVLEGQIMEKGLKCTTEERRKIKDDVIKKINERKTCL